MQNDVIKQYHHANSNFGRGIYNEQEWKTSNYLNYKQRCENLPAEHCLHAVAPRDSTKYPAAQPTHTIDPVASWYRPCGHNAHETLPPTLYRPVPQVVHTNSIVFQVDATYLPASHLCKHRAQCSAGNALLRMTCTMVGRT